MYVPAEFYVWKNLCASFIIIFKYGLTDLKLS